MSYILEALKKSERERKKEGVPDLQADHSQPLSSRPGRKPLARWLAGVMVLLFLGGGGWFWWQGQEGDQPLSLSSDEQQVPALTPAIASPPVTPQASMASESSSEPVGLSPEIQEKISREVLQAVTEVRQQNQPVPVPVAEAAPVIPEEQEEHMYEITDKPLPEEHLEPVPFLFEELPAKVRDRIPELSFAGHVYADDAGKRLIVINNRIVREGDLISKGLSLVQITLDGVIMRYQALEFRVKLF